MRRLLPLEYEDRHKAQEGPLGSIERLLVIVGLYPVLFLIVLHALWGLEYAAAGQRPGPQHHGPVNPPMEVMYAAVFFLFLGALLVGLLTAAVAGTVLVTERGRRGRRLAALAAVVWLVSLVVFLLDPVGAWNFYLD